MYYVSTRGHAPKVTFSKSVLGGLAEDGGLYVPEFFPKIHHLHHAKNIDDIAFNLLCPFIEGDPLFSQDDLKECLDPALNVFKKAMSSDWQEFEKNHYILELFHGPTLAFKDVAMQFLGKLFENLLLKEQQQITIIGATSGDTGSAALEAFKGKKNVRMIIFHPYKRVSDIQRKQMTTIHDENVVNVAIKGSFDDCQNMVKRLFNDKQLREKHTLSAVNSINWARIMAQMTYYACLSMHNNFQNCAVNIAVPTGNFGNILAAYYTKKCGFPIDKLAIGTNENDILARFFHHNDMHIKQVMETFSPSMDIQISSNFERFLYDICYQDSNITSRYMHELHREQGFTVSKEEWQKAKNVMHAFSLSNAKTLDAMKAIFNKHKKIVDPHSVIAIETTRHYMKNDEKWVSIATASPIKFLEVVERATGEKIGDSPFIQNLMQCEEKLHIIDNDFEEVKNFINGNI